MTGGEAVEYLVLDFKDAFKMLHVHPAERKYLAGQAMGGYFVYRTVLFGVGSGPLVWGRVAWWMMRATQAMFHGSEVRVNCFVDDPIVALRGITTTRRRAAACIIAFWAVLGGKLAYQKGQMGKSVEWIGASLTADRVKAKTSVRIPARKHAEVLDLIQGVLHEARGMVKADVVRQIAGKASWIAGLLPQLKPFVRQLWAAMSGDPRGKRTGLVYTKQVLPALKWLERFHAGYEGDIVRDIYLVDRELQGLLIESDASPHGGGAACWIGAVGRRLHRPPDMYVVATWTQDDELLLGARIGDPASQAVWEAFMVLLAVRHFVSARTRGKITVVGDALGVWHGLAKFSAKSPSINEVAKELAMYLAPLGHEICGIHVWSEANVLADALSRLSQGGRVPQILTHARREDIAPRGPEAWMCLGRSDTFAQWQAWASMGHGVSRVQCASGLAFAQPRIVFGVRGQVAARRAGFSLWRVGRHMGGGVGPLAAVGAVLLTSRGQVVACMLEPGGAQAGPYRIRGPRPPHPRSARFLRAGGWWGLRGQAPGAAWPGGPRGQAPRRGAVPRQPGRCRQRVFVRTASVAVYFSSSCEGGSPPSLAGRRWCRLRWNSRRRPRAARMRTSSGRTMRMGAPL